MSDTGLSQGVFKSNYIDVIKRAIPEFYDEVEFKLFGEEEDHLYRVLGKILYTAKHTSALIQLPNTDPGFSSNRTFVPYFVPSNKLSRCTPKEYERNILMPLGRTFSSFKTANDFSSFLITSALPLTRCNDVSDSFAASYSSLVDIGSSSVALCSNKLVEHLGWAYFLNTSGEVPTSNYIAPSSILVERLTKGLYYGDEFTEEEGVSTLFEWMYRNILTDNASFSSVKANFLPAPFNQPSSLYSDNYYASGAQLSSSLDSLIRTWVSTTEEHSLYFKEIVDASLLGTSFKKLANAGPMGKMLKALSYGFYDLTETIRDIQELLDIDTCPKQFLEFLGHFLGWQFLTDDHEKWRQQLRNAIYLYKSKGTRRGIAQAAAMIIPSSVWNPSDSVSGLREMWESYFPNLLYYTIKTESNIGESKENYRELISAWNKALDASGINIKLTNFDSTNLDNNIRFLVDYILEFLDHKYKFLKIGGYASYKDSPYYQAQLSANQSPGYFARGKKLSIPPWEEQRFYQNCFLKDSMTWDVSALLSRKVGNLGVGIPVSACTALASFLGASGTDPNHIAANPFVEPGFGMNSGFKFFTSGLELPFNYTQLIEGGNLAAVSLFDYWSSKSSEVHTLFVASGVDFAHDDYIDQTGTQLGRKGIPLVSDIFRQFAPFHVLNKLFVGLEFLEDYYATDRSHFLLIRTISSEMDQINSNYSISAFPGTHNTGIISGIGPNIYNPKQGRYIPSASLHNDTYFFSGGGSQATVSSTSLGYKKLGASPRVASRRKNYKYKFSGWPQTRNGLNQPVATDFFSASSTNIEHGLHISGFVPKGWNFSAQTFFPTSGALSAIYADSITSSTIFYEFAGSSFFPARAVTDLNADVSSWVPIRDIIGTNIIRVITRVFIRRGEIDSRWLNFSEVGFENFKFGEGIFALYRDYNTIFRRQLYNWVLDIAYQKGDKFAGGLNVIAHAFGPLLFNHNFSIKGLVIDSLSAVAFPKLGGASISSVAYDWSALAGSDRIAGVNKAIVNTAGTRYDLLPGILQANAWNTYQNPLDIFERRFTGMYSNGSLMSGVDIVSPQTDSFAVKNDPLNSTYNVDKIGSSGLTLVTRSNSISYRDALKVRFCLDGNVNYAWNGKFKFASLDGTKTDSSLSAIAGWQMVDQYRTPSLMLNTTSPEPAISFVDAPNASSLDHVHFVALGHGSPGDAFTPCITSVSTPIDIATPPNLRYLDPGQTYRLAFESSGTVGTACVGLVLVNETKKKQWTGTTWAEAAAAINGNTTTDIVRVGGTQTSWITLSSVFSTSSMFEKGDLYRVWLFPTDTDALATARKELNIRDIGIYSVEPDTTQKYFNGVVGNKLFPDQDYKIGVSARVAKMDLGDYQPETIAMRVIVEQKPFAGNGWEEHAKLWAYNWNTKFWDDAKHIQEKDEWQLMHIDSDSVGGTDHEFGITTKNNRTPLKYYSKSVQGPMDGYFLSAGPVHDSDSVYYIEIVKPYHSGDFNGVTLLNVNLVNSRYNEYVAGYEKRD